MDAQHGAPRNEGDEAQHPASPSSDDISLVELVRKALTLQQRAEVSSYDHVELVRVVLERLEEKEKDFRLAAELGRLLLTKNEVSFKKKKKEEEERLQKI
jgi:hypothetical protein